MNWIRENKFLTGFIAIMVIGAGVLGYLLYSAYGTYSDVTDEYNAAAGQLHQLQTRVPYPDQDNLTKYKAERDDLKDATHTLADQLSQMVLPIEELSPSAFQDRLRDTVTAVIARAVKTGVKLPDKFAMDLDQYQSQPPPAPAAGPLGRQLAALQIAMDILVDEHVDSVTALSRSRLPQEGGVTRPGGGGGGFDRGPGGFGRGPGGPGRGGNENGGGAGGLVEKYSFDLKFTATQASFQKVLNDFAASSKQFFITRTLVIENSDPKPVSKAGEATPGAPVAPAAPGSPATSGTDANYLKFLVGTEKLNVAMRVDMVAFNSPDKSTRKAAAPAATH